MDSFLISVNATLPLFIPIAFGMLLRKISFVEEQFSSALNKFAFRALFPFLLFNNIYSKEISSVIRPRLIVFSIAATLCLWLLCILVVHLTQRERNQRGALIQGMYRSNFIIYGLPTVINLYGVNQTGVTSFMIAVIVPIFNFLAVITLETYGNNSVKIRSILMNILKNPLIISSCTATLFMVFRIPIPQFFTSALSDIAGAATPIALIVLGAMLRPTKIKKNYAPLSLAVIFRLAVAPLLIVPIAILIGFRSVELATILAIFASPTSVSSFVMAKEMNNDGELAGQIVVFSTLFACLSVFLWVFGLHSIQLL